MIVNTYDLTHIILNTIKSIITFQLFKPIEKVIISKNLYGYDYIRTLQAEGGSQTAVALYQNNLGQKVVAKIWQGKYKNYSYFTFQNEYLIYKCLNQVIGRVKSKIPSKLKNVHLPKLIGYKEENNQAVLMIEWIDGKVGIYLTDSELLQSYLLINKYLDFLSNHLTPEEYKLISKRTAIHYYSLYLINFVIAIIKHPSICVDLIRGMKLVLEFIPQFFKKNELTLVHRDLNFENILKVNNKIYIIDFQFLLLTYKSFEFASTIRYCYDKGRLSKEIEGIIHKSYKKEQNVGEFYTPLRIMHATHGLTASNFNLNVISAIKSYLRESI